MSSAFPMNFRSFCGTLFTILTLWLSLCQSSTAPYTEQMPVTPGDFTPAVRFAVCSDSHNNNRNIADMIETCYTLFDNDPVYAGIDLFAFCGDMTSVGENHDMDAFKAALDEHIREGSQALVVLGNHELKNLDSRDYYKEIFGCEPDRHITVKGFHFIGISNYAAEHFPTSARNWAAGELDAAEREAPGLPVFTFQHPHNSCTVYGSVRWATPLLASVWDNYSNVVNFSGHSHFPINDPRSIWQGAYTSLGCGAMNSLELEKDLVIGQHPEGYDKAAQFYVVEADRDGSVRIRSYDLISDKFFGEEYYIDNVNDASSFAYTYKNRMNYADAPTFAPDTSAKITENGEGEYILTFDKATANLIVHDYKVDITALGVVPVYSRTLLADYYLEETSDTATYNLGKLAIVEGVEYKLKITAANAYYELSEPFVTTFIG